MQILTSTMNQKWRSKFGWRSPWNFSICQMHCMCTHPYRVESRHICIGFRWIHVHSSLQPTKQDLRISQRALAPQYITGDRVQLLPRASMRCGPHRMEVEGLKEKYSVQAHPFIWLSTKKLPPLQKSQWQTDPVKINFKHQTLQLGSLSYLSWRDLAISLFIICILYYY